MSQPILTISSKNYSSWSLRGWLLCKISGLEIVEHTASVDDTSMRAELLCYRHRFSYRGLEHEGARIWGYPVDR